MTNFQATLVNVGYGQLALRDSLGRISQKWTLSNPKCVIGTGTNCNVSCNLPGIADHHALLVIGARQIFLRALAPGLSRCGENISELVIPGGESEFGFEIAGHHFVYSRIASSKPARKEFVSESAQPAFDHLEVNPPPAATSKTAPAPATTPTDRSISSSNAPSASSERLRFTFVRALEKNRAQSRSDDGVISSADLNERPAWVEEIVRQALRPVESRLDDLSAPLNNIQRRLRRDARQRKLKRQARQTTPKNPRPVAVPPELLQSQSNVEKLVGQHANRLDQIVQNVNQLITKLANVDQRLGSTSQAHDELAQKSVQSNFEIAKLQQEMLSLFRQLQVQLERPTTSDEQHLWQSNIEAQLAELQSSMLALEDIKLTLEMAIGQTAALKNEIQAQRDTEINSVISPQTGMPSPEELSRSISETITSCLNQEFTDNIQSSLRKSILGPLTQEVSDNVAASLSTHLAALTQQFAGLDTRLSGLSGELSGATQSLLQNQAPQISPEDISVRISDSLSDSLLASLSQSLPEVLAQSLSQLLPEPISQSVIPSVTQSLSESLSLSLANTVSQSIAQSIASLPRPALPEAQQSAPVYSNAGYSSAGSSSAAYPQSNDQSALATAASQAAAIASAASAYGASVAVPQMLHSVVDNAAVETPESLTPAAYSLPSVNDSQPIIELEPIEDEPGYESASYQTTKPEVYDVSEYQQPDTLEEVYPSAVQPEIAESQYQTPRVNNDLAAQAEAVESFEVEEPLPAELPSWWTNGSSDSRPVADSATPVDGAQTPSQPSWPGQNYFERNYFQSSHEPEASASAPADHRGVDDHAPHQDGYLPSAFSSDQLEIDQPQMDHPSGYNPFPATSLPDAYEGENAGQFNPYQPTGYEPVSEIESPYAQYEQNPQAHADELAEAPYAPVEDAPIYGGYDSEQYQDTREEPQYEPLPERPTQSVPAADNPTVRATEVSATGQEDGDESVEDYMRRLLARMRGVSENEITLPGAEQAKAALPPAPKDPSAVKPAAANESAAGSEPISEDWTEPFDPDKYVPRGAAPEKNKDLNAMREIANNSARSAIQVSARRRQGTAILMKSMIALVGLIAGIALVSINGARINIAFIATVASFLVTIIWGYDCVSSIRPLLQSGRAPKESAGAGK